MCVRKRKREKEEGKAERDEENVRREKDTAHAPASINDTGWLRLVGSLKLQVSFAEYPLFYRALLQKKVCVRYMYIHNLYIHVSNKLLCKRDL